MSIYTHIYGFFLKWLTGYDLTIATKAVSQWKVQESSSCSVHKAEYLSWASVDIRMLKMSVLFFSMFLKLCNHHPTDL